MRDTCETMDVIYASNPKGGLVTINKSDFDPEKHTLPGDKPKRGRPKKVVSNDDNG